MPNQIIEFPYFAGNALTVDLFAEFSDALIANVAATEATNRAGTYLVTFVDQPEGRYRIIAKSGALAVYTDTVFLEDADGTYLGTSESEVSFDLTSIQDSLTSIEAHVVGGGGDATAAKQDEIRALLTKPIKVYTQPQTPDLLELIRGDAYDGVSRDKIRFDAGQDITGKVVRLSIRQFDDSENASPLLEVTGVGVGTEAEIPITSDQSATLPFTSNKQELKFDVEVEMAANSFFTPAGGACTVAEDQTRR